MKILYSVISGAIVDASNLGAWDFPDRPELVIANIEGDAETYQWPEGSPSRCRFVDGVISAQPAFAGTLVKGEIVEIENQFSMLTERGLREWFLQSLIAAGVPESLFNPATPIDENSQQWLALPMMARRAITAERLIRSKRAQL